MVVRTQITLTLYLPLSAQHYRASRRFLPMTPSTLLLAVLDNLCHPDDNHTVPNEALSCIAKLSPDDTDFVCRFR